MLKIEQNPFDCVPLRHISSPRLIRFTRSAVALACRQAVEMASRRNEFQEDLTLRALRLIGENPTISQRDLASRVGISVGAAHYCLTALAEKGLIKLGNFQASKNKRGYAYILTPKGIAAKAQLTVSFLRRKLAEYDALKAEIADLEREVGGVAERDWSST